LDVTAEEHFVEFIDRVLDNTTRTPGSFVSEGARILDFLRQQNPKPPEGGYHSEFRNDLAGKGETPNGINWETPGWDKLASLIIVPTMTPEQSSQLVDPSQDEGVDYLRWYLGFHGSVENPRAQTKSVVWLTKYDGVKNVFPDDVKEALAKVGVECYSPNTRVYLMVVNSEAVWDKLHIPTVADSEFYYMWAATRRADGSHGMTLHTTGGRGQGVPELVIRREDLREVIEAGAVKLESLDLGGGTGRVVEGICPDPLLLSSEHARSRWQDEIRSAIL